MTDPHATDVLALLDRLASQERECGRLREQLEFHLRLAVTETPADPRPGPTLVPMPSPVPKLRRGALEALVLQELVKCDALKTRELAALTGAHEESVRACLVRLIKQAKVQRMAQGRYGLAQTAEEA